MTLDDAVQSYGLPLAATLTSKAYRDSIYGALIVAICFFLGLCSLPRRKNKLGATIPKGPWGLPLLGSFPFLTHYPELTLDHWARKFGNLYSLWLGDQLFMIVSDPGVAKDLLVSNGAVFSSRKEMFIKSQTVFAGRGITATPYNDRWKQHRRIASIWLNTKAVDGYTSVLDYEATDMLKSMFNTSHGGELPINPQTHAGRCSLNNMLSIAFDFRTNSVDDPMVKQALKLSRAFMNCTGPVSNLVDFVPMLQRLPLPLRKRARTLHHDLVETYGGLIADVEKKMKWKAPLNDCLAKTMLEMRDSEGLDHLDMSILASAFMIGGVETTASIMQWFSALIPAYPEIQRKAQAELDEVVGRDRLPTLEDEAQLPYCRAIIKEVERCHNPFWLGTPHCSTQDFTYNGQFIPKDTVVVLNTYTMHHDPTRYEQPVKSNPDRYLTHTHSTSASANLPDPYERDNWMFGAGRRICPGMVVAERELWLVISRASSLLELPAELRNRIYGYMWANTQPMAVFCDHPPSKYRFFDYDDRRGHRVQKNWLTLLQTCRQVHDEASPYFYGDGDFDLRPIPERRAWDDRFPADHLHLFTSTLRDNIRLIRHLTFDMKDAKSFLAPQTSSGDYRKYLQRELGDFSDEWHKCEFESQMALHSRISNSRELFSRLRSLTIFRGGLWTGPTSTALRNGFWGAGWMAQIVEVFPELEEILCVTSCNAQRYVKMSGEMWENKYCRELTGITEEATDVKEVD